ncbi:MULTISPECIES: uracil phosphoribosyltransferase [unclassified Saccharibacter]|uniref:uracil phosphoribosyltransferase n=1 Tax=unclassified Saccharibacter TaxID=2648722 RepID=UPI0013244C08|nr:MULTISPECIES: uracil phosphoribosyltransferase [unclassified Saccharibacter]MXV35029.1 uracil phosphoribosyltransferase [Saccharibacter sp. EH611]MXV57424.1 uracil phosphoribosyltransferase [Saccharibacter sp. EH70]MXV64715.1 uracil phosphoribosyltransferase [Saccharibacter sp. EH60]
MSSSSSMVRVLTHPLVRHKLAFLRQRDTPIAVFRASVRELSLLLAYETLEDLPLMHAKVLLPDGTQAAVERMDEAQICFVPILRAGCGLLDGMLDLVPSASVGHVGMQRDHVTLEAEEYYFKVPDHIHQKCCIVLDPMLATGNSADAAITRLKQAGAKNIIFACLIAAPEGVALLQKIHPDVRIITCSLDEKLNEKGYIVPGLGDAGDRFFGTN